MSSLSAGERAAVPPSEVSEREREKKSARERKRERE
jgi:hypothetical protein